MSDIDQLTILAANFQSLAEKSLEKFAAEHKQKYTVWWRNPDKNNEWDIYQSGLSKTKADALAHKITLVMSPRWFDRNVPTRVLPDGSVI